MIKHKIDIIIGDITLLSVDAVVNAANPSLLPGGGVNGQIHQAAGPALEEACRALDGCQTGQAKLTKGYDLPAKLVIHSVGPVWRGGAKGESRLLASCYLNSLRLAVDNQVKTLALPALSCGINGFPLSQAATIALHETANFLERNPALEKVIFVCADVTILDAYQQAIDSLHHD